MSDKTLLLNVDLIVQVCYNACMRLKLGCIYITLCVIRSMSDVELTMCFESAQSVPKLFTF